MPTIDLDPQSAVELRRICERVRDEEMSILRSIGRDYTMPGVSAPLDMAWKILVQLEEQGYAND